MVDFILLCSYLEAVSELYFSNVWNVSSKTQAKFILGQFIIICSYAYIVF